MIQEKGSYTKHNSTHKILDGVAVAALVVGVLVSVVMFVFAGMRKWKSVRGEGEHESGSDTDDNNSGTMLTPRI